MNKICYRVPCFFLFHALCFFCLLYSHHASCKAVQRSRYANIADSTLLNNTGTAPPPKKNVTGVEYGCNTRYLVRVASTPNKCTAPDINRVFKGMLLNKCYNEFGWFSGVYNPVVSTCTHGKQPGLLTLPVLCLLSSRCALAQLR